MLCIDRLPRLHTSGVAGLLAGHPFDTIKVSILSLKRVKCGSSQAASHVVLVQEVMPVYLEAIVCLLWSVGETAD